MSAAQSKAVAELYGKHYRIGRIATRLGLFYSEVTAELKRLGLRSSRTYRREDEDKANRGPACVRCGLSGAHECLQGDATKGWGTWR